MGIPGLLQGLKSSKYTKIDANVRDFAGQALAVDASSWLHKSVYPIAEHYVEATWGGGDSGDSGSDGGGGGDNNNKKGGVQVTVDARSAQVSTDYMIQRCHELQRHAGIKRIYLVFDGQRCPLKANTNAERERKRLEHLQQARECKKKLQTASSSSSNAQQQQQQQQQKQYREQMFHHYKTCIKVTKALADAVAAKLQQYICNHNNNNNRSGSSGSSCFIELVMSPYEADAQLVQLVVAGLADAVVTEDSDVLVYSAACQVAFPTLFKLDRQSGSCHVISMDWLLHNDAPPNTASAAACRKKQPPLRRSALLPMTAAELEEVEKKGNNSNSNSQLENILSCFAERRDPGRASRLFVQACILAGCDYAPNLLQGIGLVTAFKHVRTCMHKSPEAHFRHVLKLLPGKAKRAILLQQQHHRQQQQSSTSSSSSSSSAMDAYEELLAKSEAVFYYHPVMNTVTRRVTFFTTPPPNSTTTLKSSTKTTSCSNHQNGRPSLARFQGDWSFLANPQDLADLSFLQPPPPPAAVVAAAAHNHDSDEENDVNHADDVSCDDNIQPTTMTTRPISSFHSFLAPTTSSHHPTAVPPGQNAAAPPTPPLATSRNAPPCSKNKPAASAVVMVNPYRRTTTTTNNNNKRPAIQEDRHDNNRPEKRTRGPLAPKSPNVVKTKSTTTTNVTTAPPKAQSSRHPKNLFAKFEAPKKSIDKENAHGDDDDDSGEQQQQQHDHNRHHDTSYSFSDHRKKQKSNDDVRFVKPVFDANNGSRRRTKGDGGGVVVVVAPNQQQPLQAASACASSASHQATRHHHQQQHQQRPLLRKSRNIESGGSDFFSQRNQLQYSVIRDDCSRIVEPTSTLALPTRFDQAAAEEEEEENMSEFDANPHSQPPSFLEPSTTTHGNGAPCGGTNEKTFLPQVSSSSEEGFDYYEEEEEKVGAFHPSSYSSTLIPAHSSLRFASHGDDIEQVNDAAAAAAQPPLFQNGPSFWEEVRKDDSTTQEYRLSNVHSRRHSPFARDTHLCSTSLMEFGEDNETTAKDNFNDLLSPRPPIPPPFRIHSFLSTRDKTNIFHNAFSSRLSMGLESGGSCDNVVDLTETSCPPFENPSFCTNTGNEEPTTTTSRSDYFSRPRLGNGISRRITLESPTQPKSSSTATTLTAGRLQNNPIFQPDLPRPAPFDLYDEFLSPKKLPPTDEDIDDSSPLNSDFSQHQNVGQRGVFLSFNLHSQRSNQAAAAAAPLPKAKSMIGPAKTLRKRFKSCGAVNNHNNHPLAKALERQRKIAAFEGASNNNHPLARAFERQRKIAAFEGTAGSSSNRSTSRGGAQQRRRLPNLNQSTLMFSFSSTSHHQLKK